MRFSDHPLIQSFLERYDRIPEGDQDRVPIEAVALSAGIDVRHLWGEIMLAMREQSVSQVKLIAVAAHPQVTRSRVRFSKQLQGHRDRDALDIMLGAIASPKGPTFINKFFAGGVKEEDGDGGKPEAYEGDVDAVFPDVSKMQDRVQPMRQRVLEAVK